MAQRLQLRRGTYSQWSSVNPVLAIGELGLETDTGKFKIGNGITVWDSLPYSSGVKGDKGDAGSQGLPGQAGDQGSPGYTPIKDVDYFDGKDGTPGYTPIKNIDYFDGGQGIQGNPGSPGYTPRKGIDYFDGIDGDPGSPGYTPIKGIDYFDGEKGDPGSDATVTKPTVEAVLTGAITSHTHNYEPANSNIQTHIGSSNNPHGVTKSQVSLSDVPNLDTTNAVNNQHTHSNKSTLDSIQEAFTTALKTDYDEAHTNQHSHSNKTTLDNIQESLTTALKGNYDTGYSHSQAAHAPTNAQKNSDIIKSEIETVLTGEITSHTHAGGNGLSQPQIMARSLGC